jgi:hypothetical protein
MPKSQSRTAASVERYSPERPYKPLVPPPSVEDKDACAIYASVRKDATPSHEPIELASTARATAAASCSTSHARSGRRRCGPAGTIPR